MRREDESTMTRNWGGGAGGGDGEIKKEDAKKYYKIEKVTTIKAAFPCLSYSYFPSYFLFFSVLSFYFHFSCLLPFCIFRDYVEFQVARQVWKGEV